MSPLVSTIVTIVLALIAHGVVMWFNRRSRRTLSLKDVFSALTVPLYILIWVVTLVAIAQIWVEDTEWDEWLHKTQLLAVIVAIVVFLIRLQGRIEKRMRDSIPFEGMKEDTERPSGWGRIFAFAILVIGLLVALQVLGINVSSVIAFGGFGALAVGIAGRELFANLFGGRMLYLTRSFIEGDKIEVPKERLKGVVQKIGWYQTTLLLKGDAPVTVPNSFFMSQIVINTSRSKWETRQLKLRITSVDSDEVGEVCGKLAGAVDSVELLSLSSEGATIRLTEQLKKRKKTRTVAETLAAVQGVVGERLISLALE